MLGSMVMDSYVMISNELYLESNYFDLNEDINECTRGADNCSDMVLATTL